MHRYYKSKKSKKPASGKGAVESEEAIAAPSSQQQQPKQKQSKKAQSSAAAEPEEPVTELPQDDTAEPSVPASSKRGSEERQEREEEKENQPENTGGAVPSSSTQVTEAVSTTYHILRKSTGALGGNGYQGAIYGELTMASMQRVTDILKTKCGMDQNSCFIDVGSGLGKPSFHVAQDPGVALSFGIELEEIRWQLAMHNLKEFLHAATAGDDAARQLNTRVNFMCGDIDNVDTLDPFTHIYMYDLGFPPPLQKSIARKFNSSARAQYLVSYRKPRSVIQTYGYDVELIDKCPTSMHGSGEIHTAYFYKKASAAAASSSQPSATTAASSSASSAAAAPAPAASSSRTSSPEQTRPVPREVSTPQRRRRPEEPPAEVLTTPTASRRRLPAEMNTTSPAARRHQGITVDIPTADGQMVSMPCAMAWKELIQLAVGPVNALVNYAEAQVESYLSSGRPRRNSRRVRLFDA